jgi:DNA-directed RNA polymerase specialized sigma24 family protein
MRSQQPPSRPKAMDTARAATFDTTYAAQRVHLTRIAFLIIGSQPLSEGVVNDAFLAAYPRWDLNDSPEAYLRRAVVNGATTESRSDCLARSHRRFCGAGDSNNRTAPALARRLAR